MCARGHTVTRTRTGIVAEGVGSVGVVSSTQTQNRMGQIHEL